MDLSIAEYTVFVTSLLLVVLYWNMSLRYGTHFQKLISILRHRSGVRNGPPHDYPTLPHDGSTQITTTVVTIITQPNIVSGAVVF